MAQAFLTYEQQINLLQNDKALSIYDSLECIRLLYLIYPYLLPPFFQFETICRVTWNSLPNSPWVYYLKNNVQSKAIITLHCIYSYAKILWHALEIAIKRLSIHSGFVFNCLEFATIKIRMNCQMSCQKRMLFSRN